MTQSDKTNPNNQPVTAVKKWIKLYSDNPMHEAIGRIIDCCEALELTDCDRLNQSILLYQASVDLEVLTALQRIQEYTSYQRAIHEQKSN